MNIFSRRSEAITVNDGRSLYSKEIRVTVQRWGIDLDVRHQINGGLPQGGISVTLSVDECAKLQNLLLRAINVARGTDA